MNISVYIKESDYDPIVFHIINNNYNTQIFYNPMHRYHTFYFYDNNYFEVYRLYKILEKYKKDPNITTLYKIEPYKVRINVYFKYFHFIVEDLHRFLVLLRAIDLDKEYPHMTIKINDVVSRL